MMEELITNLEAKVAELEAKNESLTNSLTWRSQENSKLENEISQLHVFLDTLPNIPDRKSPAPKDDDGNVQRWNVDNRSVLVRLASWLTTNK